MASNQVGTIECGDSNNLVRNATGKDSVQVVRGLYSSMGKSPSTSRCLILDPCNMKDCTFDCFDSFSMFIAMVSCAHAMMVHLVMRRNAESTHKIERLHADHYSPLSLLHENAYHRYSKTVGISALTVPR